jgi:hypothetical protein
MVVRRDGITHASRMAAYGACTGGPPKRSRNALYGVPAPNGYRRFHGRTVHSVSR